MVTHKLVIMDVNR